MGGGGHCRPGFARGPKPAGQSTADGGVVHGRARALGHSTRRQGFGGTGLAPDTPGVMDMASGWCDVAELVLRCWAPSRAAFVPGLPGLFGTGGVGAAGLFWTSPLRTMLPRVAVARLLSNVAELHVCLHRVVEMRVVPHRFSSVYLISRMLPHLPSRRNRLSTRRGA